ncbi:hypothetical protein HJ588_03915 [Flexivirga sp. ID2601S]|uniref:Uncharacterized protein n=1 Tax=Flexivirga aerilata TaxID=1656889 RepID=A0A849AJ37_9MICO|nr:hypothetical protein [Flexivirga aerilata]NNG38420.1 hypothetical protein [Flexivirga aerilata]
MSHDQPGQDGKDPRGGRDEFDHFFTDRNARRPEQRDPDATAWGEAPYDDRAGTDPYDDRTQAAQPPSYGAGGQGYGDQHSYVQPPRPDEDYYGYEQGGGPYYGQEQEQRRRGNAWAPVLVIVASLLVVGVVAAIALTRSNNNGSSQANSPLPTQTVTKTQTHSPTEQSPTQSESQPSSSSESSASSSPSSESSSASPSTSYATDLPASASPCPGGADYGTGPRTTCAFAGVVASRYQSAKDADGNASFSATSPETHQSYDVTCTAGQIVTCVTTTNATVYMLRK